MEKEYGLELLASKVTKEILMRDEWLDKWIKDLSIDSWDEFNELYQLELYKNE